MTEARISGLRCVPKTRVAETSTPCKLREHEVDSLRAAALCRRPLLADRGRWYDNYDYAFFVGFNGTLKAYRRAAR